MHPRSSWTCPSTYLPLFFTSFTFFKAPNHYLFVHLFLLPFFFFFFLLWKMRSSFIFHSTRFLLRAHGFFVLSLIHCFVPFFFFFPAFTKIHQLYSESKLLMLSDVLMNCFFFFITLIYFKKLHEKQPRWEATPRITWEAAQMGNNPQKPTLRIKINQTSSKIHFTNWILCRPVA
jgi:hypothetical protein